MERKTVTVIGANGAMGRNVSAIFASFGNAKVYMVCRNLEKAEAAKKKSYQSVKAESIKARLIPLDYSSLNTVIPQSDIVFESTAESWEVKSNITKMIADIADKEKNRNTVFCSGSSGLSITGLAECYPDSLRPNYLGMHLFNPPYSMTLCEITPTKYSNRRMVEEVKTYCREVLLRTVVEVRDSPAFLANRIGFQFINGALRCAEKYQDSGGIDYIDSILGPFTGRTMPPLATSDFVGLDVHKAIADNLYQNTHDFAHEDFKFPAFAEKLAMEGKLGRKTGSGLYKTLLHDSGVKIREVYDIGIGRYRQAIRYTFPFVENMTALLKVGNYEEAFQKLTENHSREAELCLDFLLKYVLYSLSMTEEVGYDIHSADDVMAAGFNWCPPLAMIQALSGVGAFSGLCRERLDKKLLESIDMEHLLKRVEPSKYDYRRFIQAKK